MSQGTRQQLTDLFDDVTESINQLTTVCERLSRRIDAIDGRTPRTPQPRQGTPTYMSGRWWRRDGTMYGRPP